MVFDRRRRRAHWASRDARLPTGCARAIDSRKASENRGFHEVDGASPRARADRAAPPAAGHGTRGGVAIRLLAALLLLGGPHRNAGA
jgi:hypothetical protein